MSVPRIAVAPELLATGPETGRVLCTRTGDGRSYKYHTVYHPRRFVILADFVVVVVVKHHM